MVTLPHGGRFCLDGYYVLAVHRLFLDCPYHRYCHQLVFTTFPSLSTVDPYIIDLTLCIASHRMQFFIFGRC